MTAIDRPGRVPDVSVVVPTHNRRDLLSITLRSILGQRDVAFEVIVVDDGSTDHTSDAVREIGDPRIRVVRHDVPQGVSAARNRGIDEARGSWLAFCDDDDLWAPDKLARQLDAAATGCTWVYVGHVDITMGHRVTQGSPPLHPEALLARLPGSNVVPGGCSGVMARKDLVEAAGRFDPQLSPMADWDLWLRLARLGAPASVPRPLVAYRVHGDQMSLNAARMEREFDILAARHGEGDRAVLYRYLGWWALRVHRHGPALRYFIRGSLRGGEGRAGILASDLGAWGRHILQTHVRVPIRPSTADELPEEIRAWRAEGQAWVDGLLSSIHPDA